jgi:aminopeptidase N
MKRFLLGTVAAAGLLLASAAGIEAQVRNTYDSGGPLSYEQAAYDVTYYDLDVAVHPEDSTIAGRLQVNALVHQPIRYFILDLDTCLYVERVLLLPERGDTEGLPFSHTGGQIRIRPGRTIQPGERVRFRVDYSGRPRIARRPPWDGGFTWALTPSGKPWITTTCQGEGADIWWPNKDHPCDEPDSMAIHITVPRPLIAASNGRLRGVDAGKDGTSTFHWFVSTPINMYNVALNIAEYRKLEQTYTSVSGETMPVVLYVIPEHLDKGKKLFQQILAHLDFFEELLGPYPFRADKCGTVETPHLGMEHQTIIAYGAKFDNRAMTGKDWGFDALHHHEFSHEWFGNLMSNADWSDMWLHEGFGSYMQALYVERLHGSKSYRTYMARIRRNVSNRMPLAPDRHCTSTEIYGGDIYVKGAWVVHTLRYLMGDEVFFRFLRRMAYPDEEMERIAGGGQCWYATSDDFQDIAEHHLGMDLEWFVEVYLRQPELPVLHAEKEDDSLKLTWEVPEGRAFPMPVEIQVNGTVRRVDVPHGGARIAIPEGARIELDPNRWILKEIVEKGL